MTQCRRDRLSAKQRTEMWRRWKAAESLDEMGRALGNEDGSIGGAVRCGPPPVDELSSRLLIVYFLNDFNVPRSGR